MDIVKEIGLDFAKIQLLKNQIIRVEMFNDVTIDFNECCEINNAIGELANHKESLIMMVPGDNTHFSSEARDFSASEEGMKYTIGDAIVVRNLAQKILISFYLKFNKPPKPSSAFSTEEQAMNWLLSLNNPK